MPKRRPMVYLDTSVVLAHLLSEDVRPPDRLWGEPLISSRLTEYETRTRLRALNFSEERAATGAVASQISFIDLVDSVLLPGWEGLPSHLRTLDGLHLATALFLRAQGVEVQVATYDRRLAQAVQAAGFELYPLEDEPPQPAT